MIQLRHWWIFFILFFAVGITTWLTFTMEDTSHEKNKKDENTLDAFATEVHITNLDKTGKISAELYAPSLSHYSKNNNTHINSPVLTLHVKNQPAWQISSNKGELRNGLEEVFLESNVILHQPQGTGNDEITVQTPTLTVYPEKQIAMTEEPITLSSQHTHIDSTGMQADLKQGTLQLKTKARGQYEIPAG